MLWLLEKGQEEDGEEQWRRLCSVCCRVALDFLMDLPCFVTPLFGIFVSLVFHLSLCVTRLESRTTRHHIVN